MKISFCIMLRQDAGKILKIPFVICNCVVLDLKISIKFQAAAELFLREIDTISYGK